MDSNSSTGVFDGGTLTNSTIIDPYAIGTLPHHLLWGVYISFNAVGVLLCCLFMNGIYLLPSRTSADIFVGGLCSGCVFMSVQCGTQCLLSIFSGRFAYGEVACQLESFFHFTGVLTQFFSITLLAFRNYLAVIRMKTITSSNAIRLCIGAWACAAVGTYLIGSFSQPRLLPSGTYCLYAFTSPAFRYWFMPVISVALASVIWLYWRIFWGARAAFAALRAAQEAANHRNASGVIRPRSSDVASQSRPSSSHGHGAMSVNEISLRSSTSNHVVVVGGGSGAPESPPNDTPGSPDSTIQMLPMSTLPSDRPTASRSIVIEMGKRGGSSIAAIAPQPKAVPVPVSRPINREMARARAAHVSANRAGHAISLRLARRSILFVGVFALGWTPPIICFLYEAIYNENVPEGLDITVAIAGTFHSVMVPLAYGYNNAPLRTALRNRWPCLLSFLVKDDPDSARSSRAPASSNRYSTNSQGGGSRLAGTRESMREGGAGGSRMVFVSAIGSPPTGGSIHDPVTVVHPFGVTVPQQHGLFNIADDRPQDATMTTTNTSIHPHPSFGRRSKDGTNSGNNSPQGHARSLTGTHTHNFANHRRQTSIDSTTSNSTSSSGSSGARTNPFVAGTNATSRILATSVGTGSGPGVTITVTPASPTLRLEGLHAPVLSPAPPSPPQCQPPNNPHMTFLAPPGAHGTRKKKKRTSAQKQARAAAKAAALAAAAAATATATAAATAAATSIPAAPPAAGGTSTVPITTNNNNGDTPPVVVHATGSSHHRHHHHHHHHHSSNSSHHHQPRRARTSTQPFREQNTAPPLVIGHTHVDAAPPSSSTSTPTITTPVVHSPSLTSLPSSTPIEVLASGAIGVSAPSPPPALSFGSNMGMIGGLRLGTDSPPMSPANSTVLGTLRTNGRSSSSSPTTASSRGGGVGTALPSVRVSRHGSHGGGGNGRSDSPHRNRSDSPHRYLSDSPTSSLSSSIPSTAPYGGMGNSGSGLPHSGSGNYGRSARRAAQLHQQQSLPQSLLPTEAQLRSVSSPSPPIVEPTTNSNNNNNNNGSYRLNLDPTI
jgi:hypothetical protein